MAVVVVRTRASSLGSRRVVDLNVNRRINHCAMFQSYLP